MNAQQRTAIAEAAVAAEKFPPYREGGDPPLQPAIEFSQSAAHSPPSTSTAAALELRYRPLASLLPYAKNARTHSATQIAQLASSMREFGFTNPVLIDPDGCIIAGHGRVLAAKSVGLTDVPTIALPHLSESQRRAYVLADNQLALGAGWDVKMLSAELAGLCDAGFDCSLIGFSDRDLDRFLGDRKLRSGNTDENDVPPLEQVVISRPGDLWRLGDHRLLCGDCTVEADVAALLGNERPHLMVTDPPYGVQYAPEWRQQVGVNDSARMGKVANDDRADWRAAWALFPGSVAYVWHAGLHAVTVAESLVASGFELRAQIIWAKARMALSRGHYHWAHEPCWYAVRKGDTGHWTGDRTQKTLWEIDGGKEDSVTTHSTQKPVEAMRRPIQNNSNEGQLVYEPFAGSGTTVIAAEQNRRGCRAIELDPAYVDMIIRRWEAYTGQQAREIKSDATLRELADQRAQKAA